MIDTLSATVVRRRSFLGAGGALIVGFSIAARAQRPGWIAFSSGPDQPDQDQLDTWLAIHADNTATIYLGFVELGQGCSTALLQIAAEELDLEMVQLKTVRVETSRSPNQGSTSASAAIHLGGPRMRLAAAEARHALLGMASQRLGVPPNALAVDRGRVSVVAVPAQSVTYGELIGDRRFDIPYTGAAPVKDYRSYRIVGTNVPRNDIPDKASGKYVYMQHVRVPGMLHGRVVRPRGQGAYRDGARVVSVDPTSIANIAGARVVRRQDFLGVVAPDEWSAVKAAQQLRVTWDQRRSLPPSAEALFERMRAADTIDRVVMDTGDVSAAIDDAAHVLSHRYDAPYHMHAPFAPNCALADVRADSAVVMCSTQNVYVTRRTVAEVLDMPEERVTVRYYEGSGIFGRGAYHDAAQAAAVMSQEAGAPVRVQFMRWDDHGWDNYGPAHTADVTIACDDAGNLVAYQYHGWQHTWTLSETTAQLTGTHEPIDGDGPRAQTLTQFNVGDMYKIPNWRILNHRVPGVHGYLKGASLRSPLDVAISFGAEQTLDELAYVTNRDPYRFRRQNIKDERWLAVLTAVAEAAHWTERRAASNLSDARVVSGRGIALGTHLTSYAAAVAEVEVDRQTGVIVAKKMYGALEAGRAINPGFIENQITGMLVQAASRVLKEEVKFSPTNVTTLDWASYPLLRFAESPEVTAIVVQRLDQESTGAGEEVLGPAAAAIANAFFDATGVRLRRQPMTPDRVLAALRDA